MARIESLNLLLESTGKDFLSETYGEVIENVEKSTISSQLKNRDLSGDPTSGSVEAKRFTNAKSDNYGTARAAAAGQAVRARPITVQINVDREIVEEIEQKDTILYGVDGLLTRRSRNHAKAMIRELERAFFVEGIASGTAFTPTATDQNEIVESLIQQIETTQNGFVDGVDRDMISVIMSTTEYGKLRNFLDTDAHNANVNTAVGEMGLFHGTRIYSSVYLPNNVKMIGMVDGSIAQPVLPNPYSPEKVPLSNAWAVSLFYSYGTKTVTPDLIQYIATV